MAKSSVSVEVVASEAAALGLNIKRLAPSWGWFEISSTGRKLFAKTNDLALQAIQEMKKLLVSDSKDFQLFQCRDARGVSGALAENVWQGQSQWVGCAPSKAALVRMLNELQGCGPGTGKPGYGYKVRKYWTTGWPPKMAGMHHEHGLFEVGPSGVKRLTTAA
jgi:hypothetical protein